MIHDRSAVLRSCYTESLTVEDIRDHFDEIRNEDGYAVPANLTEELQLTLRALGG